MQEEKTMKQVSIKEYSIKKYGKRGTFIVILTLIVFIHY